MKILSFNCRGLGSFNKKLPMSKLLLSEPFDILFLQETLGQGSVITHLLESWLLGCTFHALDATGHYVGLALGVNNHSIRICNTWGRLVT